MKRRGFTIIELMMVVGIIAILLTFVATSVSGVIKNSRARRKDAIFGLVEQGVATYYAQFGSWPWTDKDCESNKEYYDVSSPDEVKSAIFKLVKESKEKNNPMMDISGLYVSERPGNANSRDRGMDFMTAVRGSKEHPRRTPASRLYYGYPNSDGYFKSLKFRVWPTLDRAKVIE